MEPEKNRILIRKIGGIMAMAVGIPNLLIGLALTLSGIGAVIALVVMMIRLYDTEPSDSLCGPIILVLVIILVIVLLFLAIIFTIISFIFAIGVAGQSIGGFYGFRGLRFYRSVFLTMIGSIVSLIAGIGLIVAGLAMKDPEHWVKIGALILGVYEIVAFFASMTSMILFIAARSTFTEPEKEPKKKKGKNRKKRKEK